MRFSSERTLTATMKTISTFLPLALVASAAGTHAADEAISLEIPDIGQEKRRPRAAGAVKRRSRWPCRTTVHTLPAGHQPRGKPVHPDLYANEVPVAMSSLGLEFKAWQGEGMPAFLRWVQSELAAGHPVLLGVKIYPTAHPEWGLDHFVLAVGCTKDSLTYNTTWKGRKREALPCCRRGRRACRLPTALADTTDWRLQASRRTRAIGAKPTRIRIDQGRDKEVELHVTAENLEPGKRYRLVEFTDWPQPSKPARGEAGAIFCRRWAEDGSCRARSAR